MSQSIREMEAEYFTPPPEDPPIVKTEFYCIIPSKLVEDSTLSFEAKGLCLVMDKYANWTSGECWPAQKLLAEKTGKSESYISKLLKELANKGYIIIKRRGQGKPNLYICNWRRDSEPFKQVVPEPPKQVNQEPVHKRFLNPSPAETAHKGTNYYHGEEEETITKKNEEGPPIPPKGGISHTNNDSIPYQQIIEHLNLTTGQNYRHTTEETRKLIRARWKSGFRLADFETVHRKKATEWMETEQQIYLRPITLYGPKFESYLNQLDNPVLSEEEKVDKANKAVIENWIRKQNG